MHTFSFKVCAEAQADIISLVQRNYWSWMGPDIASGAQQGRLWILLSNPRGRQWQMSMVNRSCQG